MLSFCWRLFIPGPVTVSRLGYKNNCPNSGLRTTQPNYKLLYKLPYLFSAYLLEDPKQFGGMETYLQSIFLSPWPPLGAAAQTPVSREKPQIGSSHKNTPAEWSGNN